VEQERAERQRQAEEGQLRWDRVFQNAGWGIALLRPEEGTLQVVNPAFARLHGRTPEQIQGLALAELVAPEARGELAGHFARADRDGQHAYESLHCRADGTPFPVLAQLSTIADKEGRPLYRALNLQDVTASKQTEAFLRDQARALAESDKRKNEFLAVLAHELRNPLAPILTSVRVLGLLGSAEPPVAQAREIIERQARQLARLVDDLLDVTRIAQGKLELRRGRFDLSAAVTEAVQQTAPLVEAAGHQLVVRLPPGPLPLEADQARIVQVVVNLLNNAAKYTDRGGHIELSAAQEGEEVVLRVRDNGVGIAREMLGRVFDLFTQVEGAAQRAQGGLGIGLTLVRRLVELHGGTVSAHSEGVGRGSEFSVRLPAAPSDPAEGGLGSEAAPSSTVSRHVLIIEDEADNRATLATLLRLLGHRVEVAANGREGVERALAGRPEVALVDLRLPLLDGYEVARQVRAALGGGVRLIALTGSATEEDRQRSREAGFDAHLAKPVDPEQLERLLSRTG
jgi:PAS domain S-box-containing protein